MGSKRRRQRQRAEKLKRTAEAGPQERAVRRGTAGKTPETAWAMAFLALGLLSVAALLMGVQAYSRWAHAAARSWPAVPCKIVVNDYPAAAHAGRERFGFEYEYAVAGQTLRSRELDLIPGDVGDAGHYLRRLARAHPEGTTAVCYVDPADPTRAVFDREHMEALGVLQLLSLPFLVGGLLLGGGAARLCYEAWYPHASVAREADGWFHRFCGPRGTHAVSGAALAIGLFIFCIVDGRTHLAWLLWPASQETNGVVVWVNRTGARQFGFRQRQFEYVYQVGDHSFEGRSYGLWTHYPLDTQVAVQFDPQAPERSYLTGTSPSWSPGWVAWPMFVFAVIAAAVYACVLFVSCCRVLRGPAPDVVDRSRSAAV